MVYKFDIPMFVPTKEEHVKCFSLYEIKNINNRFNPSTWRNPLHNKQWSRNLTFSFFENLGIIPVLFLNYDECRLI